MQCIIDAFPKHRREQVYDDFIAFYTSNPVVADLKGRMQALDMDQLSPLYSPTKKDTNTDLNNEPLDRTT
jgi:hypothetical protein